MTIEEAPRRGKKKRKAKKSGVGLYVGLGVGALVVVLGIVVLIFVLNSHPDPQPKQMAQDDKKAGKENPKAAQDKKEPEFKLPIHAKKPDGPVGKGTQLERAQSQHKLQQLAKAMHSFAAANNDKLPKADNKGLSWRVALLPSLEQEPLYNQFRHNEPWDSAHNKKLIDKMPAVYVPVYGEPAEGKTYYQVFTGKHGSFANGQQPRLGATFRDGTSNTLLIVEGQEAVVWTQPGDIEYNEKPPPKVGGMFTLGFNAAMADTSVRFFFHSDMNPTLLHGLITPAGGEILQLPEP